MSLKPVSPSLCSAPLDWLANDGCCPYIRKDLNGDIVCDNPMGPNKCEMELEIDEYMDFEESFNPY